jgi:hypothetical protein
VNGLITYDRRIIRMNETLWKQDTDALYAAAARRGSGKNATDYVVIADKGVTGMQMSLA